MNAHAVTLQIPDSLYHHFKQKADRARRSLESELLRVMEAAGPEPKLPEELEEAVRALAALPDDELWQIAARSRLSETESTRLESLHIEQQSTALDDGKKAELADLLARYERAIVVRAEAVRVLHERGHDVSRLIGRQ